MMEMGIIHMLQGCLQYVEELTSWIEDETDIIDDLGGWLPGWYVVEDVRTCSPCMHSGLKCDEKQKRNELTTSCAMMICYNAHKEESVEVLYMCRSMDKHPRVDQQMK